MYSKRLQRTLAVLTSVKPVGLRANDPFLSKIFVTETQTNDKHSGERTDASQFVDAMTDGSQTLTEADTPTVDVLKPKRKIRVATWNVRTLYQAGKLAQLVKEFDDYRLEILGVCESRLTGSDKKRLQTGHSFIYSGRKDDIHEQGVGLLLSPEVSKSLLDWKPLGPRMLRARFNSRYTKLTVIVCYAPTEEAEEDMKDGFYEQLQAAVEDVKMHDMLLIIGDFNARTGNTNTGRESVIGRHGLRSHLLNDNGDRMCGFCESNRLVVGSTLFQHRDIHKITWVSPDGNTKAQLDHILINNKWRSSLQDVRAYRGAECGSDHNLVVGEIKLKLRKTRKGQTRGKKIDCDKLRDNVIKERFKLELRNRFQLLMKDSNQEVTFESFHNEICKTGETILGLKKRKKEEWIRPKTWEKINARKATKQKMNATKSERIKNQLRAQYSELNKEVKKLCRGDKKSFVDKLANEAEEAANRQDLKALYKITKTLNGKCTHSNIQVRSKKGEIISEESKLVQRWKEHFVETLNRPEPVEIPNTIEAKEPLEINCNPPTLVEVKTAIQKMKNGKAAGLDGVTADMLKAEEILTPKLLRDLLEKIWISEETPTSWTTGLIVKLPKKGNLTDCNNWRGITLLSVTSKILSRIIHKRLSDALDKVLRQEQAGFRPGRSCSEHIFTMRQILEQSQEWNSPIYANFIDFQKAFDSVHRDSLWKILLHYGVPNKLVNVVKMLYRDSSAQVLCDGTLTDVFQVRTGVKQGCVLSPFLFSLAIDWIMTNTINYNNRGIQWSLTEKLEDLDFADDIVLLAHRYIDMQEKTNDMTNKARQIGLELNRSKTKHMRMNAKSTEAIHLHGNAVEEVNNFTYLGSKLTINGSCDEEIQARISKASQAFGMLKNTWKARTISLKTKLRLFKSNVQTTLLYGAESWKMTKTLSNKLEAFQRKCLRKILRIFWPDTIRNESLYAQTNMRPITEEIRRRRWRWIGHVLRRPPTAISRVALRWTPAGKRSRGRPKETWRRTVEAEMNLQGWKWNTLEKSAKDRDEWRSLVGALCAEQHFED